MNIFPNLTTILNDLPYHYFYPQVDEFLELNLPFKNFSTLPLLPGMVKNTANILKEFKPTVPSPVIIPFKPSAKVEHICSQNNWKLAAGKASLNRRLEDKLMFTTLSKTHQIPIIPNLIGPLSPQLINQATDVFGQDLVIQTHFGWAGLSTYLYNPHNSVSLTEGTPVKIMPLLAGTTYTNNCCLTRWGSIIGTPGLQINGLLELSTNSFATTGRQWPSFLPTAHSKKLHNVSLKIAKMLSGLNFRGFYGVDYLVTTKDVYVLEINPRLTASVNFYTQLELKNNITPTLFWHLAEFLDLKLPSIKYDFKSYFFHKLSGSEITPKSSNGHTVKKHWLWTPVAKRFPPQYDLKTINGL